MNLKVEEFEDTDICETFDQNNGELCWKIFSPISKWLSKKIIVGADELEDCCNFLKNPSFWMCLRKKLECM